MTDSFYDAFATSDPEQTESTAPTHVEPEPEPEPKPKPKARRRPAAKRTSKTAESIIKGIQLAREIDDYPAADIAGLAEVFGVDADADHIAAAIASGSKGDTALIESVVGIREAENQFAAGILAHQLTEKRRDFNKVWSLVGHYADIPTEAPRASTDAAMALAGAISEMSDDDIASIRRPLELLER